VRLKPGRPDLARHTKLFAVPVADERSPVSVTFLGVSTLLFAAAESAIMTDGFFSRPGLRSVAFGRIAPDASRITACLGRAGVSRLDGVLAVHSHFDHVLDSAVVAAQTGGVLVGGQSTANVGRGHGLPEAQIAVVQSGATVSLGSFSVTLIESEHCPPDRYPGVITAPVRPPARATAYRCGEAWSMIVTHDPSGRRALVQGSAGFRRGALSRQQVDVAYLGVGQLGVRPESYIREYWAETIRTVGARRAVLTHWDDFFRPLDQPLRALPYAGDDLDATIRVLTELSGIDGVELTMPTVWSREDPWALVDKAN
jgi:L-ascorbate metabolism protein UlaG (beta-lactamase superfamily)